jgi:predicted GH43/DUF377 family glycosyl hydrolase
MKWIKHGCLFSPVGEYDWMQTHAANPFGVFVSEHVLQVYFTCRDAQSRSHIASLELDLQNGFKVKSLSAKPVLVPGELGLFDDSGTAMGFLLAEESRDLLYYLGWNLKQTVPWLNSIGLAIRKKGEEAFTKTSRAPILDRSNEDPFSISYPSILKENGIYRMWYGSNLSWGKTQEQMQHVFKYAESEDGIHWRRDGKTVLGLEHPGEYALSKPMVIKRGNKYILFYSYRANGEVQTYRIGYAVSDDGLNWTRKDDQVGINVSDAGWDSEMICYPFVFEYQHKLYILYNGNGYGRSGFGLAELANHESW